MLVIFSTTEEEKKQYCKYFFVVLYKLPMVQQIPIIEVQCQSLVAEKIQMKEYKYFLMISIILFYFESGKINK